MSAGGLGNAVAIVFVYGTIKYYIMENIIVTFPEHHLTRKYRERPVTMRIVYLETEWGSRTELDK